VLCARAERERATAAQVLAMTERKESIPTPGQRGPRPARSRFYKQLLLDRRSGPTALIALAALVGFIVWLVVESRNDSSSTYSKKRPTSVYVAYPGAAFQVEVYHPDAARAQRLARSGRVQPVVRTVESQARGPVAVSPPELKALASSLGHPIYWAGPRANTT